ncbi:MAG: diacylglycerol kinase family protein [Verrucomicrobiota bacterium]|nr:diacylglycerol kinase family protein [Verrucomicrobiota bacterium]
MIFNPTAKGDRARRFQAKLEGLGDDCVLRPTTEAGGGMSLAEEAVREGFETIVAAGGDGTINEVVNGMVRANGLGRSRLGVLPWGSVNVFAKELGIPSRFEEAWKLVLHGAERLVDLGWMELGEDKVRRCFVQLAGAGLDGRAVELVNWETKKRFGDLAYVLAGWQALGEKLSRIEVRAAGREVCGQLALVGNGRFYGGKHVFFPSAKLDDGVLDLVVVEDIRRARILKYGWAVLTDGVADMKGVHSLRASEFEMRADNRVPVEMEGDAVGVLPARGWVEERVLRVLVQAE